MLFWKNKTKIWRVRYQSNYDCIQFGCPASTKGKSDRVSKNKSAQVGALASARSWNVITQLSSSSANSSFDARTLFRATPADSDEVSCYHFNNYNRMPFLSS